MSGYPVVFSTDWCGDHKLSEVTPAMGEPPSASDTYMSDNYLKVVEEVGREVARATSKFPSWPSDPLHALAVLGEEYGELTKAMLQLTYEPDKTSAGEVRKEAIQTAAMALRLAMSLDRYGYSKCHQHVQPVLPVC
jgi:NTP pyrophosphatase (non-canonical NTP hydrolase)